MFNGHFYTFTHFHYSVLFLCSLLSLSLYFVHPLSSVRSFFSSLISHCLREIHFEDSVCFDCVFVLCSHTNAHSLFLSPSGYSSIWCVLVRIFSFSFFSTYHGKFWHWFSLFARQIEPFNRLCYAMSIVEKKKELKKSHGCAKKGGLVIYPLLDLLITDPLSDDAYTLDRIDYRAENHFFLHFWNDGNMKPPKFYTRHNRFENFFFALHFWNWKLFFAPLILKLVSRPPTWNCRGRACLKKNKQRNGIETEWQLSEFHLLTNRINR